MFRWAAAGLRFKKKRTTAYFHLQNSNQIHTTAPKSPIVGQTIPSGYQTVAIFDRPNVKQRVHCKVP